MHRTFAFLSLGWLLLILTGCVGHVTPATDSQKAALIERVKSLAGTWETTDDKGVRQTASIFTVSSAGSAVREVMFPDSPHEMTNMYTMDGPSLVVTHYCAMGNQPHMRAFASADHPNRIELNFDGVSNKTSSDQMYMGGLTIEFKDADHITEQWRSYQNGKQTDHSPAFELTRKK